uniref:Uncharacterized protein n=1 Tax=Plectus sambesii TaxID=2011161 RepID=A0A914V5L5_9BILA
MSAAVNQPQQQQPLQTLRSRQIAALKQLINLNQPVSGSIAVEPVWKVLVFDRYGQDIISPLLSVKELRDLGVTLHLLLDSMREALSDVPCVYFILPSEDNVRIVCQDFSSSMYEGYYLNFISALSRPRLEELATSAVQNQSFGQVQKVFDQYLNFISLEDDLFTLRRHNEASPLSFYAMNRADMSEETMNALLDEIVDGLFSVCVTLGVVPIIRCPRNNAAEQVAQKLDKKLRDNLRDARNNLFTQENVRA